MFLLMVSRLPTARVNEVVLSGTVSGGDDQTIIDAATVSLFKAKDSLAI